MSSKNTLKEIAMFAILTAKDINDTIMLLTMLRTVTDCCYPMVLRRNVFNLRNALNDRSA